MIEKYEYIAVLSQGLLSRIVGGSHFTVGVTRRLLLSSAVSLLVINLLTIRGRVFITVNSNC